MGKQEGDDLPFRAPKGDEICDSKGYHLLTPHKCGIDSPFFFIKIKDSFYRATEIRSMVVNY